MKSFKQHPFVILGIIIFFTVTALVVFRLSSGAKTDQRKSRLVTVSTVTPVKQDLDIHLAYTGLSAPSPCRPIPFSDRSMTWPWSMAKRCPSTYETVIGRRLRLRGS